MNVSCYSFPAMKGIQARQPFYVVIVPLDIIPRIFSVDDDHLPVNLRSQRTLNKSRVPKIARYMVDNPNDYILPTITASVSGDIKFKPISGDSNGLGTLEIPIDAQLYINDGQHRRAAIEEAIKERRFLGQESISVVLYVDHGLKRSQQIFADLNINPVKPAQSIKLLFNHRDNHNKLTQEVIERIPLFNEYIEYERSNISSKSNAIFTFSALHAANLTLLSGLEENISNEEKITLAIGYWNTVINNMPDWKAIYHGTSVAADLRNTHISVHGIVLQAIATVGNYLLTHKEYSLEKHLSGLSRINWLRSNIDWNTRALNLGKIMKTKANINLVAAYIFHNIDIELPSDIAALEAKILSE